MEKVRARGVCTFYFNFTQVKTTDTFNYFISQAYCYIYIAIIKGVSVLGFKINSILFLLLTYFENFLDISGNNVY